MRQLEENTEELNRALMETRDELLAARLNVRTTTLNCGATESNVCVIVIHYLPDVVMNKLYEAQQHVIETTFQLPYTQISLELMCF